MDAIKASKPREDERVISVKCQGNQPYSSVNITLNPASG
jgi:hypothetical protein